jgi:hypothetical protein
MKSKILLAMMALFSVTSAWAVGTCTVTDVTSTQIAATSNRIADAGTVIVTVSCTSDASAGTYPSITVPLSGSYPSSSLNTYNLTGYFLYQVGRVPGTTAPTANYTTTITDVQGFALDLGLLTSNGSATASQLTAITNATTLYPVVRSALTLAITGNSVNSAKINLTLIFRTGGPGVAYGSPSGAAGGDLSGTYPNPTVTKINGVSVTTSFTTPKYIGSSSSFSCTPGVAAGTGATCVVATNHTATTNSGVLTLTTGTGTTTGTAATVVLYGSAQATYPNCYAEVHTSSAVSTVGYTLENSTGFTRYAFSAPAASTVYTIHYGCGY